MSTTIYIDLDGGNVLASEEALKESFAGTRAFTYSTVTTAPIATVHAMSLSGQRPNDVVMKAEKIIALHNQRQHED
tara:strand:+ start:124214 stop:124441 length:228 start_codon:yes stop_codon:yes gene_type:complete